MDREGCRGIVLGDPGWHPGVIGIVAQRIVERFIIAPPSWWQLGTGERPGQRAVDRRISPGPRPDCLRGLFAIAWRPRDGGGIAGGNRSLRGFSPRLCGAYANRMVRPEMLALRS